MYVCVYETVLNDAKSRLVLRSNIFAHYLQALCISVAILRMLLLLSLFIFAANVSIVPWYLLSHSFWLFMFILIHRMYIHKNTHTHICIYGTHTFERSSIKLYFSTEWINYALCVLWNWVDSNWSSVDSMLITCGSRIYGKNIWRCIRIPKWRTELKRKHITLPSL